MYRKAMLAAAGAIALSACVSGYSPPYEAANGPYDTGYFETQIDANRYRVQYRTDASDPTLAEDWAFRRAAELTDRAGYDWFQVLSRSRAMGDDALGRYDRYRYGDADASYGDRYERPRYADYDDDRVVVLDILMGNDPPPRSTSVYDADRVLDNARRRY